MNLATATQIATNSFVTAPPATGPAPLPAAGRSAMVIHSPAESRTQSGSAAQRNQESLADGARTRGLSVFRVCRPTARVSAVADGDESLTMWRDDAFSRTDLADRLTTAGRDCLVIAGGSAQIECLATATRAVREGFCPVLVLDALSDSDEYGPAAAARYVRAIGGTVCTTAQLLHLWDTAEPNRAGSDD